MKKALFHVCSLALMLGLAGCLTTSTLDEYKAANIFVLADPVTQETASMLYLLHPQVIEFDGVRGSYPAGAGFIIPSGTHAIVFVETGESVTHDFKPKRLYKIFYRNDESGKPIPNSSYAQDGTNDQDIAEIRQKLEYAIPTFARIDAAKQKAVPGILPRAAQTLMGTLRKEDAIAIVGVTYGKDELARYVADELEYALVNNNFIVTDRGTLDKIRQEQQMQLSGEVDDATAVSIGKFAGAQIVIVGTITGRGELARLCLRALSTETAQVAGSAMELSDSGRSGKIQSALQKSTAALMESLSKQDAIAIVGNTSGEDIPRYIADGLESMLVNNKFTVVDRSSLDKIRQEQRFQFSGDVDDSTAVSVGKFAGAKVVIVAGSSGSGELRRLRLRALHTETARVIGAATEAF
jgi:curli biogenesis system outer membrane secretion channel CsgG